MADATVRPAEPSDAAEITRIQLDTWRAAYADLLPAEILAGLDAEEAELTWRQTIEQGPAQVLVAVEGDWIVGFCAAGLAPEDETAGADGSPAKDSATVALVSTVLVEPRWGRRGHGGRLLARRRRGDARGRLDARHRVGARTGQGDPRVLRPGRLGSRRHGPHAGRGRATAARSPAHRDATH